LQVERRVVLGRHAPAGEVAGRGGREREARARARVRFQKEDGSLALGDEAEAAQDFGRGEQLRGGEARSRRVLAARDEF
jgi:hypothetical protein